MRHALDRQQRRAAAARDSEILEETGQDPDLVALAVYVMTLVRLD